MGDRKYIFLSLSQLNAIQKSRALMTFLQTTLLRYNCIFSCVFWFLRIELGSMCNFRLSPSENSVSLDTLGISARNLAHYNISQNQSRFVYLWTQMFYWDKFKGKRFFRPRMHRTGFTDTASYYFPISISNNSRFLARGLFSPYLFFLNIPTNPIISEIWFFLHWVKKLRNHDRPCTGRFLLYLYYIRLLKMFICDFKGSRIYMTSTTETVNWWYQTPMLCQNGHWTVILNSTWNWNHFFPEGRSGRESNSNPNLDHLDYMDLIIMDASRVGLPRARLVSTKTTF